MNNRSYLVGVLIVLLLLLGGWWFWKSKRVLPAEAPARAASTSSANTVTPNGTTSQSAASKTNSASAAQATSNPVDPKVAQIEAMRAAQNAQAQDFYGKAIDQYGQPVAGAMVTGTLMKIQGVDVGTQKDSYTTQSDDNGNFEFTGLHGWQLGVVVKKTGYEMKQGAGFYQAPNEQDKTSSGQRAIFHMWKLKGAEPMLTYSISTAIPCNGTPTNYDLLTGKKVSNGGDFVVTLVRNPVNINRGKPFDWSVTLAIPSGGLTAINDLYPNEAPADGYQPSITVNMPSDMKSWDAALNRSFYFRSGGGQTYGRININIQADFQPPPTYFGAEVLLNPSPGDRNLEYDPTQAIKP